MAELILADKWVYHNRKVDYPAGQGVHRAAAAAEAWRAALEESRKPRLTALYRHDGWWLLHARKEPRLVGRDKRGVFAVFVGRLAEGANAPWAIVNLLKAYAQACGKVEDAPASMPDPGDQTISQEEHDKEVAIAALSLGQGRAATLTAAWLPELLTPNNHWSRPWFGVKQLDWYALVEDPLEPPPPGLGLMLLDRSVKTMADQLWSPRDLFSLDLGTLLATGATAADRCALIDRALVGATAELPSLSPAVLTWMAGQETLRSEAFGRVEADQLDEFLKGLTRASHAELARLRPRGLAHGPHGARAATLLERDHEAAARARHRPAGPPPPDPFEAYHALFPEDEAVRFGLLSDPEQRAWKALRGAAGVDAAPATIDGVLGRLAGKNVKPGFPPDGLAWACASGSAAARPLFADALVLAGLSRPFAEAALGGRPPHAVERAWPALAPHWGWLQGVKGWGFLSLGPWVGDAAREWWAECVRFLRDHNSLKRGELYAEGLRRADSILLGLAEAPECILRLVDEKRPALVLPVAGWPEGADLLLATLYQSRAIWKRIAAPLSGEGLRWLEGRLPAHAAGELRQGREALSSMKAADWGLLAPLAPLLRGPLALGQIGPASLRPAGEDRARVLSALIEGAAFPADKCLWLRSRLVDGLAPPPMPDWTAREMMALLPLLDPVNDVLLVVLNREETDGNEPHLLARLQDRLAESGPPAPPPYRPGWVEKRRAWVAAFHHQFGWPAPE